MRGGAFSIASAAPTRSVRRRPSPPPLRAASYASARTTVNRPGRHIVDHLPAGTVVYEDPGRARRRSTMGKLTELRLDPTKPLSSQPGKGHNRWHPAIPPAVRVEPGDDVVV